MADDYNISYSYQTGSGTPAPQPTGTPVTSPDTRADTALYAFADCERVDMQNGGTLLIHKHSDNQMIVAPEVSIALHSCRTFRTLQQHVDILTTTIPQLAGQQADVANVQSIDTNSPQGLQAWTAPLLAFTPVRIARGVPSAVRSRGVMAVGRGRVC